MYYVQLCCPMAFLTTQKFYIDIVDIYFLTFWMGYTQGLSPPLTAIHALQATDRGARDPPSLLPDGMLQPKVSIPLSLLFMHCKLQI